MSRRASLFLLLTFALVFPLGAAEEAASPTAEISIDRWLTLGPVAVPLPAFADEDDEISGGKVTAKELLQDEQIGPPRVWPAAGDGVVWVEDRSLPWTAADGPVRLEAGSEIPHVAHLAVYVETGRFMKPKLVVESPGLLRVWVDGEQVAEKTEIGEGEASAEVPLTTGRHLVVVKAVRPADGGGDDVENGEEESEAWTVSTRWEVAEEHRASLKMGISPRHGVVLSDLLDVDQISSLDVSPDGLHVALEMQNPTVPADFRETWYEIRRVSDGAVVRSLRGSPEPSGFAWGPEGVFGYVTRKNGKATLWIGDLDEGGVEALLEDVENFGGFRFDPDGVSVLYSVSRTVEDDDRGVRRLRSPQDRWAGFRSKSELHQVTIADGARRQLTAGALGVDLQDVSDDGHRILVSRTRHTLERPFSVTDLYELDLRAETLEPRKIREITWMNQATYAPDGDRLLIHAGPSALGDVGLSVPEAVIPNEYEGELYLLGLDGEGAEPITRDFDPAVDEAAWTASGDLLLRVTEGSYGPLYRFRPASGSFERLETGVDVVEALDVAEQGPVAVFRGSSATEPPRLAALELEADQAPRTLYVPSEATYEQVDFARMEDFDFTTEDGTVIPGRVYYPPGFDDTKTYPLLVYYYGGVVPTERSFGGRYPKNWWAAQGYVVYVLQPSGAVGFGQERAARHVNDWGRRTGAEIIRGVEHFLDAHPFVDRERVGCFGGSYGGFMSMYLITETDLFSAAISHAGISSIASYWGEGWWGYLYSAVAGADSYPWNRPDLYVEQSPLFRADQIETPLLLLHGTDDPNVPPGESDQMYVALSVLGKDVEYVRIAGEAHWILTYPKRKLWWQTIIAWFDKHLKGEPEYWDHLWKGKG